jgi:thioredoxin 1
MPLKALDGERRDAFRGDFASRQSCLLEGEVMAETHIAVFDERNFDSEVSRYPGLAVVEFWSDNCVPCKHLTRILSQLSSEVPPGVKIGAVKVNDNAELAERFGIQGTPTLIFFKDGVLVDTRTGVDRQQVLKKLVEMHS